MTDLQQNNTQLNAVTSGMASLVWWTFNGTRITPNDLRQRVFAAGLDEDSVPPINPRQAIHRAVREFSVREGKRKIMEAVVAHEDDDSLTINLLRLQSQGSRKVAKLPVDQLVWNKNLGTWDDLGASTEAPKLRQRVQDRQTYYDGNAVRDLLVMPALTRSSAFAMRRGMYVVAKASAAPLATAQKALAGLDSFKMNVASVEEGQGWEAPLQDSARESLRGELDELQAQIDGWRDMASRVRSDTRESVLERFSDLRRRAELYSEALKVSLEDLADEVTHMEEIALDVIETKDEEASEKEATRSTPAVDPSEARRKALTQMTDTQLTTLFDALCDGDFPAKRGVAIEAIALAMVNA